MFWLLGPSLLWVFLKLLLTATGVRQRLRRRRPRRENAAWREGEPRASLKLRRRVAAHACMFPIFVGL